MKHKLVLVALTLTYLGAQEKAINHDFLGTHELLYDYVRALARRACYKFWTPIALKIALQECSTASLAALSGITALGVMSSLSSLKEV